MQRAGAAVPFVSAPGRQLEEKTLLRLTFLLPRTLLNGHTQHWPCIISPCSLPPPLRLKNAPPLTQT